MASDAKNVVPAPAAIAGVQTPAHNEELLANPDAIRFSQITAILRAAKYSAVEAGGDTCLRRGPGQSLECLRKT